jgi:hypothetical protein
LCRLGAVKINVLRPTLQENGIKLVAVGLEQFGAREFVDGEKVAMETLWEDSTVVIMFLRRFG